MADTHAKSEDKNRIYKHLIFLINVQQCRWRPRTVYSFLWVMPSYTHTHLGAFHLFFSPTQTDENTEIIQISRVVDFGRFNNKKSDVVVSLAPFDRITGRSGYVLYVCLATHWLMYSKLIV